MQKIRSDERDTCLKRGNRDYRYRTGKSVKLPAPRVLRYGTVPKRKRMFCGGANRFVGNQTPIYGTQKSSSLGMDRVPIARHHTNCPTNVKKDFLVAPIHNLVMQWSLSSLKVAEGITIPSTT